MKRKTEKLLAVALALSLVANISLAAFADGESDSDDSYSSRGGVTEEVTEGTDGVEEAENEVDEELVAEETAVESADTDEAVEETEGNAEVAGNTEETVDETESTDEVFEETSEEIETKGTEVASEDEAEEVAEETESAAEITENESAGSVMLLAAGPSQGSGGNQGNQGSGDDDTGSSNYEYIAVVINETETQVINQGDDNDDTYLVRGVYEIDEIEIDGTTVTVTIDGTEYSGDIDLSYLNDVVDGEVVGVTEYTIDSYEYNPEGSSNSQDERFDNVYITVTVTKVLVDTDGDGEGDTEIEVPEEEEEPEEEKTDTEEPVEEETEDTEEQETPEEEKSETEDPVEEETEEPEEDESEREPIIDPDIPVVPLVPVTPDTSSEDTVTTETTVDIPDSSTETGEEPEDNQNGEVPADSEATVETPASNVPQTGDKSHTVPLLAVAALSGAALIGLEVSGKKKEDE